MQEGSLSTLLYTFCLVVALLSLISADFIQEYIKVVQFWGLVASGYAAYKYTDVSKCELCYIVAAQKQ